MTHSLRPGKKTAATAPQSARSDAQSLPRRPASSAWNLLIRSISVDWYFRRRNAYGIFTLKVALAERKQRTFPVNSASVLFDQAAMQQAELSYGRFLVFTALAVGVVLVPILLWQLGSILLLGFAAILIAVLLHVVSEPLQKFTPLPLWADLLIAGFVLLAAIVSCVWIFGSTISGEFADVMTRIRAGAVQVQDLLRQYPIGRFMLSHLKGANFSVTGLFRTVVSTFIAAAEALVVIVMSAAYLAADPSLYRKGLVLLFNPARQEWADETMLSVARALRYWLLGQFVQMALIGVLSALATWLIGLPSPLALGLIATMTEFVPYLGPVLAAIPALLVAVTKGPELVVWTLTAYILIHQAEGNLIMPLIQRRMIYIPPALMLLGIASIGALAGLLGFVLAAPIVVAIFVVVQKAYVRDTLKEDVTLAGETQTSS
jgi:predicted PurR-regulated permease PerM